MQQESEVEVCSSMVDWELTPCWEVAVKYF